MYAATARSADVTVAAVDLGSNSFHLVVATTQGHYVVPLVQLKQTIALSSGIRDGKISLCTLEKVLHCLTEYSAIIAQYRPDRVLAVGTAAFRELPAAAYAFELQRVFPWHTMILSGEEEAKWVYQALAPEIPNRNLGHIVLDIGGGSTECTYGWQSHYGAGCSLNLGCLTLQKYVPWAQARTLVGYERLYTRCAAAYSTVVPQFPTAEGLWMSEGIGKRLSKALGGVLQFSRAVLDRWILRQLQGCKQYAYSVLDALTWYGAIILQATVHQLGIEHIHITSRALRHGIVERLISSAVVGNTDSAAVEHTKATERRWQAIPTTTPIRLPLL
ncbi:MAG: hypothetical protein V4490_04555 [Pseudomonadota bacterium]